MAKTNAIGIIVFIEKDGRARTMATTFTIDAKVDITNIDNQIVPVHVRQHSYALCAQVAHVLYRDACNLLGVVLRIVVMCKMGGQRWFGNCGTISNCTAL